MGNTKAVQQPARGVFVAEHLRNGISEKIKEHGKHREYHIKRILPRCTCDKITGQRVRDGGEQPDGVCQPPRMILSEIERIAARNAVIIKLIISRNANKMAPNKVLASLSIGCFSLLHLLK